MEPTTDTTANSDETNPIQRGEINLPPAKRRGRPPGSKNSSSQNGSINIPQNNGTSRPATVKDADSLESAKFIGVGFVSLVELAESFVHGNAAKKIEKKFPERLTQFKTLAQELGLQEKEKDLIASSVEKIAIRHEWMTKFAPEVVLCITLGQYTLRQTSLLRFVSNLTDEKQSKSFSTPPPLPTA